MCNLLLCQDVCKYLKSQTTQDTTDLFYVAKAAAALPGCKLTVPADTIQARQYIGSKAFSLLTPFDGLNACNVIIMWLKVGCVMYIHLSCASA